MEIKRVGNIIEAFNQESDQRSVELLANRMTIQPKKPTSRGTRGTRGSSSELSGSDIKSLWEQGKVFYKLTCQNKIYNNIIKILFNFLLLQSIFSLKRFVNYIRIYVYFL